MKSKLTIAAITVCTGMALVSGCKKEEAAPTPAPSSQKASESPDATKLVGTAQSAVTQAVTQVQEAVATQAQAAVTQVQAAAAQAKTTATDQAQGIIDRAKALVADGKFQDAMSALGQLVGSQLTPDQQKIVDELKTTIQTALAKSAASDAASALGGALGGQKK